jgi:hypothetical protein
MKRNFFFLGIITICLFACNTNKDQLDEQQDKGIEADRDFEKVTGDTTVTNEVNATGNAKSGPVEGP